MKKLILTFAYERNDILNQWVTDFNNVIHNDIKDRNHREKLRSSFWCVRTFILQNQRVVSSFMLPDSEPTFRVTSQCQVVLNRTGNALPFRRFNT